MLTLRLPALILLLGSTALAAPAPAPAPAQVSASSTSIHCDNAWCSSSTSYCLYWAGVTGYDPSKGPVPGEVLTTLGSCALPTPSPAVLLAGGSDDDDDDGADAGADPLAPRITPPPVVERRPELVAAAAAAADGSSSLKCDAKWCGTDGTWSCAYWAGMTAYDPSLGPLPGEVVTALPALGSCP